VELLSLLFRLAAVDAEALGFLGNGKTSIQQFFYLFESKIREVFSGQL
jgi:hypothetical protein